jgi:hypothetical protein
MVMLLVLAYNPHDPETDGTCLSHLGTEIKGIDMKLT